MPIYLVAAAPGDAVPGHELADPDCPDIPGLTERADVQEWMDAVGYDPGMIPAGFEVLTITG